MEYDSQIALVETRAGKHARGDGSMNGSSLPSAGTRLTVLERVLLLRYRKVVGSDSLSTGGGGQKNDIVARSQQISW